MQAKFSVKHVHMKKVVLVQEKIVPIVTFQKPHVASYQAQTQYKWVDFLHESVQINNSHHMISYG